MKSMQNWCVCTSLSEKALQTFVEKNPKYSYYVHSIMD